MGLLGHVGILPVSAFSIVVCKDYQRLSSVAVFGPTILRRFWPIGVCNVLCFCRRTPPRVSMLGVFQLSMQATRNL